MSLSRRKMAAMLPAAALNALAQEKPTLAAKTYAFDALPVRTSANGATKSRSVFDGVTTRGQRLTAHITELAPGQAPHAPQRQKHEEIIILREGTLEVTLNGETSTIGPGSIIYSPFENLTGWRNVGTSVAQYYVISIEERQG